MPKMIESLVNIAQNTQLDIPATEPFLLVLLLTLAILFRLPRCGLLAGYIFTYRWCWSIASQLDLHAQIAYTFLGIVVGMLAVIGMLTEKPDS